MPLQGQFGKIGASAEQKYHSDVDLFLFLDEDMPDGLIQFFLKTALPKIMAGRMSRGRIFCIGLAVLMYMIPAIRKIDEENIRGE